HAAIALWLHVLTAERLFVGTAACGVAGNRFVNGVAITKRRIPVSENPFRTIPGRVGFRLTRPAKKNPPTSGCPCLGITATSRIPGTNGFGRIIFQCAFLLPATPRKAKNGTAHDLGHRVSVRRLDML